MSMFASALVFIALLAVSIAHFTWAFGGAWPIRDKAMLARTVIGRPGVTHVPRLASLVVAIIVLAAGIVALALADKTGGGPWLTALGAAIGLVFLARGVAGYTQRWRAAFPEEPFATLDRRNYSPLCLFVALGFFILVVLRLI
jgi:hypothetical protein